MVKFYCVLYYVFIFNFQGLFVLAEKVFRFAWYLGRFGTKVFLFLLLAFLIVAGGFIWRVHQAPLDISFAKDYIQAAMKDRETGNYARMESAVLYWPDFGDALYLQLKGGQLLNKDDAIVLSVSEVAISFSRYGLLIGRVMPKAIILKDPTLQVVRTHQGMSLNLGERPYGPVKEDDQIAFTTRLFGYLARPGYESANDSLISRLQKFEIQNAKLRIDDVVIRQSWSLPEFNIGFYSTAEGMKGEVSARLPDVDLQESLLHMQMDYVWDEKTVSVRADMENFALQSVTALVPELKAFGEHDVVVDARVETLLDENFMPSDIRLSLESAEGRLNVPDVWDDAVSYEDLSVHATYSHTGKALRVYDTALTLGGIRVQAKADVTHGDLSSPDLRIEGPVEVWVDEAQQSAIDPLWPKALRGDNSEDWVVKKMSKGVFKDVRLSLNLLAQRGADDAQEGEAPWNIDVQDVLAEFKAEGMDVDYRVPLDAATGVSGQGRFDLNTDELSIDITEGKIGVMPVSKARLVFDKVVAVGEGGADLNIDLSGEISDVLRFISKDPINLGDRIDMDLDQVRGRSDLSIWLNFPTQDDVKMKDFKIGIDGVLKNAVLPDVIESLDLGGEQLSFSIKDGAVKMSGDATLDNRPMDFQWQTFLESEGKPFKEKITAKITADPNIRAKLGIDLSEFLEGSVDVDLTYTSFRDKTAVADVHADVTPAFFFVAPFGYEKKPEVAGKAQFKADFRNGVLHKISDLEGEAEGFSLSKAQVRFQQKDGQTELLSGRSDHIVIGQTKGRMNFVFDKTGTAILKMDADVLDARPFMEKKEVQAEYDEPAMKITVTADKMVTAPERGARDVSMYYDIDTQGRYNVMSMDALMGKGKVQISFKPDIEGRKIFYMKGEDAGAIFRAFQVYENVHGGVIEITGRAPDGANDYNVTGSADLRDFKVVEAPALSKMLSILSLTGIGEALTNDGLAFTNLEADFEWIYRKGGSLLKIKDGRTSGNALGLLFDGEYDNARRYIDVSGTIVPMSLVNEIIGSIPIVGDILTGGSGGVFAATYSIKGTSDAPEVFVNPLSVLTPGIARRVLFE